MRDISALKCEENENNNKMNIGRHHEFNDQQNAQNHKKKFNKDEKVRSNMELRKRSMKQREWPIKEEKI